MTDFATSSSAEAAFDDRQKLIPWWDPIVLQHGFVVVVGAGALGNEVIKNLALLGLGNLLIIDFDTIEISNLSRSVLFRSEHVRRHASKAEIAAAQAKAINPYSEAKVFYANADVAWEVGIGLFRRADVVLGCVDNVEARQVINRYCRRLGKPWIDAGMHALSGSTTFYIPDIDTPCYECILTLKQKEMAGIRYPCGDAIVRHIEMRQEPTLQTTSAILAAIQVQEALKVLHGMPIPGGMRLRYHGHYHNFVPDDPEAYPNVTSIDRLVTDPNCNFHSKSTRVENVTSLNLQASAVTMRDVISLAEQDGLEAPYLVLDAFRKGYSFVQAFVCLQKGCEREEIINRPIFRNDFADLLCPYCPMICPACEESFSREVLLNHNLNRSVLRGYLCPCCGKPYSPHLRDSKKPTHHFSASGTPELLDFTLAQLGVMPFDIIKLVSRLGQAKYYELSADADQILISA